MARKNNSEELIHCNVCGEDYSATYRRCPFCGERMDVRPSVDEDDYDDGYVFDGQALFDDDPADDQASPNKGGKRLANGTNSKPIGGSGKGGGRYDPPGPINWVRIITFGISLVIIIAALIIVFTVFYPMLHTGDEPSPSPSTSQPVDPSPSLTPEPSPTVDPEPSPSPSDPVSSGIAAYVTGASGGLNVRSGPGTTYDVLASLRNGDDVMIQEALDNGWYRITYVGAGGEEAAGYVKSDYVAVKTEPDPTPEPTTDPNPSGGELKAGATGKITGAPNGLRVRSGPGTTYEIQASLRNGDKVTVVEDAGNGWYQITYAGSNGADTTGYIMGEYIDVD